ncbi:TonB-dependent receptor [Bernardetia sp. ABR2-2B]|uniref:SusC/RagA family TonB-linked outer membrane protein n=1 Tax=Bernardetia sp. ABR2-2B TaxID=3127472 RepID=UPI0030D0777F
MKRKLLLSMMLMFLLVSSAWAQRTITGTVTSADGALPGATVQIKGTTQGTQTDMEGRYSISVPEGTETLVYRFVGYKVVEETIGNRTVIDVTMADGALETVFVTGYTGNKTREELVSAISVVEGEEIAQVPLTDVNQLIQGRVAGAQTTSSVGQPGAVAQIRVRGTGSVGANRSPLYVIDGVIVQDSPDLSAIYTNDGGTETSLIQDPLSNINPNDIENITVLKDAVAVALYGSRGANGVILVTTKAGKGGKTKFKLSSQYGTTTPNFNGYENLSTDQYLDYYTEALENSGFPQSVIDAQFPNDARNTNTNWVDEAFRTGITQSHDLSASGGNEKTTFFVSGSYFEQQGILIGSDFDRYSGRVNINHKANDKFSFGTQLNVSYTDRRSASPGNQFNSPLLGAYLNAPYDSPRDPVTGELVNGVGYATFIQDNFVRTTALNKRNSGTFRTLGNLNASYKIIKGLSLDAKVGIDWINLSEKSITDLTTSDGGLRDPDGGVRGRITQGITENFTLTSQAVLRYNRTFNEVHTFDVLVGGETQSNKNNSFGTGGTGFANGLLLTLNSAAVPESTFGASSDNNFASVFANANYSYMGKYRLTASVRRDGSSRFGANNQSATFWAVGGSWSVKDESFLQDVEIINLLKLRAGYGISGNANFSTQDSPNNNFPSLGLYSFSAAYNGQPAAVPSQIANPNLKWERTSQFDVGLDFGILKERINGSIDYYSRESVDLLFEVPVPSTTGFTTRNDNIGKIRNTGVEVQVVTRNIVGGRDGFSWTSTFLFTSNKNEVVELPGGVDIVQGTQVLREGEPVRSFYLRDYQGADPETGAPTWLTEEGTLTSSYGDANRRIVGNAQPKWYGSFINSVSYKGIDFSALLYVVQGNSLYNDTRRITDSDGAFYALNQSAATIEDRWRQPGDIASRPQALIGGNLNANQASTRYLEDASYVRLRNVTLGYTLPTSVLSKAKLAGVRVYVQGTNLWTATNYTGFDPEASEVGTEFFRYPNGKALTFGLDITL